MEVENLVEKLNKKNNDILKHLDNSNLSKKTLNDTKTAYEKYVRDTYKQLLIEYKTKKDSGTFMEIRQFYNKVVSNIKLQKEFGLKLLERHSAESSYSLQGSTEEKYRAISGALACIVGAGVGWGINWLGYKLNNYLFNPEWAVQTATWVETVICGGLSATGIYLGITENSDVIERKARETIEKKLIKSLDSFVGGVGYKVVNQNKNLTI